MSWAFRNARKEFGGACADWDQMNLESHNHILLDSDFIAPMIRYFANDNVLIAMNTGGTSAGIALLEKERRGWWRTFQPAQAPLGPVIMREPDDTGEVVFSLLRSLPGFALHLSISQQDPEYASVLPISGRADIETIDYVLTGRVEIKGTFDEYWASRSRNLRHHLARQRRRLDERGRTLELATEHAPGRVAACISEFGRLESKGWKGKEGTAVHEHNDQGKLYREILESFCSRGEGIIYQLLLDGKVIASELCLARRKMMVALKTSYDEDVGGLSPGLLMRYQILRQVYEKGEISAIEYYGRVRDWQTHWISSSRFMYHVNVFRNPLVARSRSVLRQVRQTLRPLLRRN